MYYDKFHPNYSANGNGVGGDTLRNSVVSCMVFFDEGELLKTTRFVAPLWNTIRPTFYQSQNIDSVS